MTAPAPAPGGFTETEMQHVLDRACAAAGLHSSPAQLLRGHTTTPSSCWTVPRSS